MCGCGRRRRRRLPLLSSSSSGGRNARQQAATTSATLARCTHTYHISTQTATLRRLNIALTTTQVRVLFDSSLNVVRVWCVCVCCWLAITFFSTFISTLVSKTVPLHVTHPPTATDDSAAAFEFEIMTLDGVINSLSITAHHTRAVCVCLVVRVCQCQRQSWFSWPHQPFTFIPSAFVCQFTLVRVSTMQGVKYLKFQLPHCLCYSDCCMCLSSCHNSSRMQCSTFAHIVQRGTASTRLTWNGKRLSALARRCNCHPPLYYVCDYVGSRL